MERGVAVYDRAVTPGGMVTQVTSRIGRGLPSGRAVERGLAGLFLALLAAYGVGHVVGGMPATVGVVAVHLAVVVGGLLPIATVGRWALDRVREAGILSPVDGIVGLPDARPDPTDAPAGPADGLDVPDAAEDADDGTSAVSGPRGSAVDRRELVVAAVALVGFAGGLCVSAVQPGSALVRPLFGAGVAGLFVLSGLVFARR